MENNDSPTVTDDALKAAVEEAEQRGYLRGLNESSLPRVWDEPAPGETLPAPGATVADIPEEDPAADSDCNCDFFASPKHLGLTLNLKP